MKIKKPEKNDCCAACLGDSFESVLGEDFCVNSSCGCHKNPSSAGMRKAKKDFIDEAIEAVNSLQGKDKESI